MLSRRTAIAAIAAMPVAAATSGCRLLEDDNDNPPDPPEPCPVSPVQFDIDWTPSAARPVWYGIHDLTDAASAPRAMRIYYPAPLLDDRPPVSPGESCENRPNEPWDRCADPTIESALARAPGPGAVTGVHPVAPPILKHCQGWPLLLFLHGHPRFNIPVVGQHRVWRRLPAAIARCGFVVAVPNHRAEHWQTDADMAAALRDIEWIRNGWVHSNEVDQRPSSTAVGGHSNGARLAIRIAQEVEDIAALISLSAVYLGDSIDYLRRSLPRLWMWADDIKSEDFPNLLWNSPNGPMHGINYKGQHFDYLDARDTGIEPRGPCGHIGQLAADMSALFLCHWMQSNSGVPIELRRPHVALTDRQKRYYVHHLPTLEEGVIRVGCHADLRWRAGSASGSRPLLRQAP